MDPFTLKSPSSHGTTVALNRRRSPCGLRALGRAQAVTVPRRPCRQGPVWEARRRALLEDHRLKVTMVTGLSWRIFLNLWLKMTMVSLGTFGVYNHGDFPVLGEPW